MLLGKELGPYVIEKELGSGAMGTVFRGKHKTTGERVAIKLMSLALGTNETAVARFVREVAILKQLDHPNIVKYKGSGRYHKAPFLIMEYIDGESLDRVIARRGRLTWEEVVEIGMHLCAALQHSHDRGIIHRDLKPSNLMILKNGVVKLTDFGIAKDTDVTALTGANSTVGTAAYMSPEQCRGARDISHKTDLYSMGIMFYELVTGRKPFTGETVMEVFLQHANNTDYKRPAQIVLDVPVWLDTLICQLMEKDAEKRPINAAAVADALRRIKEKVDAQKSAGIEAATKRRADRSRTDIQLDEDDKEAARTMLGKKKKRKKAAPFYTQGWFTITALGFLACLLLVGAYFLIFRSASAERLHSQAEALMKTGKFADRKEARDGPIAEFLRLYPDQENTRQMQDWADQIDFEIRDDQMHRRKNAKLKVEGEEEQLARDALEDENLGNLARAARYWEQLSKKKGHTDPDLHAWGLVGAKYLAELKKVDELYGSLENKIRAERTLQQKAEANGDLEQLGLDAVRAEFEKRLDQAKGHWDELKQKTETQSDRRRWYLLASRQARELRDAGKAKQ